MPSTVTIEKLVYGGDGLARLDGQVVLAPFVLPGERVVLQAAKPKKGLIRASSVEITESAPERITPRCEYFSACGGCHYQHSEYSYQVRQKVEILRETLNRLGGINFAEDITTVAADPWFYRNRIQLHFADGAVGFNKQNSHEVCSIEHCYIAAPILVEAIGKLKRAARRNEWPKFLRSLELFTNGDELQLNILDSARPVASRFFEWIRAFLPELVPGAINYRVSDFEYRISGNSFFQVNRFLVEGLVSEVIGDAAGDHAVDLYAGVGLFSLPLAKRFSQVDTVERGGSASRDLEFNASKHSLNLNLHRGSAEDFLRNKEQERPDLMIADPPRAGLGNVAVTEILRVRPRALTLVSCDPSTLARDLRQLTTIYRIRKVVLVDLFPQTYHFETIVHLEE
jgi:23S rRNA (uracil1939-C5)-methyltransferase